MWKSLAARCELATSRHGFSGEWRFLGLKLQSRWTRESSGWSCTEGRTRGHPASGHPPVPSSEMCEGESRALHGVSFFPLLPPHQHSHQSHPSGGQGHRACGAADCSLGPQCFQGNLLSRPPPASVERPDEISVLERQSVISLLRYFHGE